MAYQEQKVDDEIVKLETERFTNRLKLLIHQHNKDIKSKSENAKELGVKEVPAFSGKLFPATCVIKSVSGKVKVVIKIDEDSSESCLVFISHC